MNSVEIYEFKFDSKTEDLLKQLSDDNTDGSVCFEEIEYSSENDSTFMTEDDISTDTDYDSLDEETASVDEELAKLCRLESPWETYKRHELIGTGSR